MPTYDYRCTECDYELEAFHAMSAEPLKTCPECGKDGLKRMIGAGAGLLFKGGGFYQTDYRSDSYKKGAEAAKGGGGQSSSGSDKSSAPSKTSTPAS